LKRLLISLLDGQRHVLRLVNLGHVNGMIGTPISELKPIKHGRASVKLAHGDIEKLFGRK